MSTESNCGNSGPRSGASVDVSVAVDSDPNDADTAHVGAELVTGFAPPFRAPLSAPQANTADIIANAETGERIDDFEVVAELGRGGMGVVYLARQRSLGRQVALKMILAGAHASPTAQARFRIEAEAIARLQHTHIVQIYQVGAHRGKLFLALEYVAGGNLAQKLNGTPWPERDAARLVETLARAVHYTHCRGILHRDLNPNNVLLTCDGTPKITDFGLAKLVDYDGPTRTEIVMGTPNYMAPEQAAGCTQRVGVATDVYSLGAILYELLTGRPPFEGTTVVDTLQLVRSQEPVPPRRLGRAIARDLETICLKCLEKEPVNRYATAEELADDLRRFLNGNLIQARVPPVWQRAWRRARQRRTIVPRALGCIALLCILLTCGWYFRMSDELAHFSAEEKYQRFVRCRDEAIFYGLLAPEHGSLLLGSQAAANLKAAESAARNALLLVGLNPDSDAPAIDPTLPTTRKSEIVADCYTLLLVLASVRGQQSDPDRPNIEPFQDALRLLDGARKLGIHTRAYHLRRAGVLEQIGRSAEATQEIDRAESLTPEGALDHFLVGEEQYRRGDWEGAASAFSQSLVLQPSHFWAQFFMAVCQLKAQQWEAAKATLNACLVQQPAFVWSYLFRSFANERLHALADAEADFDKALRLNPDSDARYVLFLMRGIFYYNQGELDRAAADFGKAMDLKPDQYNAYLNLAHVYLARDQFEEAAGELRRAERLQPPVEALAGYHVELGRRFLHNERYEDSIRACDAALKLSPDQPMPLAIRARAQLALGLYGQAELSFDESLQMGGDANPDLFRGRGTARMKLGKYLDAADDYSRALEYSPDAEIYQHRGWAHFFSDAYKLALRDFEKAIDLDPDTSDAYVGRGLARVMLGDYLNAVADADAALRKQTDTPEMMHNIACIFAQAALRAEREPPDCPPASPSPDRKLSSEAGNDRKALAASYRSRAIEAVYETLKMLRPDERAQFWREKVLTDEALAPIRDDAGFRQLGD